MNFYYMGQSTDFVFTDTGFEIVRIQNSVMNLQAILLQEI